MGLIIEWSKVGLWGIVNDLMDIEIWLLWFEGVKLNKVGGCEVIGFFYWFNGLGLILSYLVRLEGLIRDDVVLMIWVCVMWVKVKIFDMVSLYILLRRCRFLKIYSFKCGVFRKLLIFLLFRSVKGVVILIVGFLERSWLNLDMLKRGLMVIFCFGGYKFCNLVMVLWMV